MNYKNLDLLNMMLVSGNGNIDIRLYGRPTVNIIRDAIYMTTPCPKTLAENQCDILKSDADLLDRSVVLGQRMCEAKVDALCAAEKRATVEGLLTEAQSKNLDLLTYTPAQQIPGIPLPINSGLLLSGIYSKNPQFIATVLAITQSLDKAALQRWAKGMSSPQDVAKMALLGGMIKDYVSGDSLGLKLYFAMKKDEAVVDPIIKKLERYLPIPNISISQGKNSKETEKIQTAESAARTRDWDFITDYLHHKILLVDGNAVMVGGRNIENSYHQSVNDEKYVFMDTELFMNLDRNSGSAMVNAYSELFNFRDVVAPVTEVNQFMPIDLMVNFGLGTEACTQKLGQEKAIAGAMKGFAPEVGEKGLKFKKQDGTYLTDAEVAANGLNVTEQEGLVCVMQHIATNFVPAEQRIQLALANMNAEVEEFTRKVADFGQPSQLDVRSKLSPSYRSDYLNAKNQHNLVHKALSYLGQMDSTFKAANGLFEVKSDLVAGYIENLPFARYMKDAKGNEIAKSGDKTRNFGAKYAEEHLSGKNIHRAWIDELLSVCQDKSQKEVILHNAYWFPPSDLIMALGKMARISNDPNAVDEQGGLPITDCGHITVKIITNSTESTDLVPVNLFASYVMQPIFQKIEDKRKALEAAVATAKSEKRKAAAQAALDAELKKSAQIEYYQYANPPTKIAWDNKEFDQVFSLHTKLSLIGNNVIVGSANADARSLVMDSNNGFIVRNDSAFAEQYRKFISFLTQNYLVVRIDTELKNPVNGQLVFEGFRNISAARLREITYQQIRGNSYVVNNQQPKRDAIEASGASDAEKKAQLAALEQSFDSKVGTLLDYLEGVREKVLVMLTRINEGRPSDYRNLDIQPRDSKDMKQLIEKAKEQYDHQYKLI